MFLYFTTRQNSVATLWKARFVSAYTRTEAEGLRKIRIAFKPHEPRTDFLTKRPSTVVEVLPAVTCPDKSPTSTSIHLDPSFLAGLP